MVTLELPFTYDAYINPHFRPLKLHLCNWALEIKRKSVRARVWVICEKYEDCEWIPRILLSNEDFSFQQSFKVSKTCKSLQIWLSYKLLRVKPVLTNFFNSSSYMRLIFHLDCEELIFDRISRNNYPNRMGLVSLWSRSENISYEVKLIFSNFGRIFIVRAWIWGCLAHVHQVLQFKKQWITLGLHIKFMNYPYEHSSF